MGTHVADMHTDKLCPGREKANTCADSMACVTYRSDQHREPRQTHMDVS